MIDLCVGSYYDLLQYKQLTPNKCIHALGPLSFNGIKDEVRVVSLDGADLDWLNEVMLIAEDLNKSNGWD